MAIADSLPKIDQELEGSKPILKDYMLCSKNLQNMKI